MDQSLQQQLLASQEIAALSALEEERNAQRNKKVGGVGYLIILLLVVLQDTAIDALYNLASGAGIALLAGVVTAPLGIALWGLAFLLKFLFMGLVFLSELIYFKKNDVSLGSKVLTMVLLRGIELLPFFSILPISTVSFVSRVYIENKARKSRVAEIIVGIAERSQRLKSLRTK